MLDDTDIVGVAIHAELMDTMDVSIRAVGEDDGTLAEEASDVA